MLTRCGAVPFAAHNVVVANLEQCLPDRTSWRSSSLMGLRKAATGQLWRF